MTIRSLTTRVAIGATAFVMTIGWASPAGAHGVSGPPASNFATEVRGVLPPTAGVVASLGPDRETIRLTLTDRDHVTVLGYRGEPYLRLTPSGVWENRSSPAVALNRTRIPPNLRPTARIPPPRWVRISRSRTASWHDHRTHWMGGTTPAIVRREPDRSHTISRWTIPLRIDRQSAAVSAAITGTIVWKPPPAAWPWWILAAALAAGVVLATRLRRASLVIGVVLAVMAVTEAVHVWASWPFSNASLGGRIGESLPSIGAVVASGGAAIWVFRRGYRAAAPALILAGLFVFVSGGLADLATLSHAFVPSRLEPGWARLLVALALGLGAGTAIVGIMRLRAPPPPT
jgi:hypothetical protein